MENRKPIKKWRYVHKGSESMDVSIDSIESNRSGSKYNRFQFSKGDEGNISSSRQNGRKSKIFAFTGNSREKNHEYSILSKRSDKDKDSDTSRLLQNQMILKGIGRSATNEVNFPLSATQRRKMEGVKDILKTVKKMTEQFKSVINNFSRKYREMKYEWDRSFKVLLSLHVSEESKAMKELRDQLDKKQDELDQLSRITFDKRIFNSASANKNLQTQVAINDNEYSLSKWAISKVQQTKEKETLSRNNTIAQLLYHQTAKAQRQNGRQLHNLNMTIRRMREILQQ